MVDGGADFCGSEPIWMQVGTDTGDVLLPTGQSIRGFVTNDLGEPLPGATIWAHPMVDTNNFDRPALSDADGFFEVVGLDTDSAGPDWTVQFSADHWPEQYFGGAYDSDLARVVRVDETPANVGEVALLPGILVGGTISGPDGPVPTGTVHAYSTSQVVTVEVQSDGTWLAMGLPPGEVITWATSPGLAQTYFPDADRPTGSVPVLEEGEEALDIDLFLPAESVFELELVDAESGLPIAGVGGLLYNDTRTVGFGNVADDDGILRIDRLHPGDWSLYLWGADEGYADDWVRGEDGVETTFSIDAGVTERRVLPLEASARITGRVRDDHGRPVDGIAIAAIRDDATGLATTTDPDGFFTLGGLGAGDWTLIAEYDAICPGDPGYVPWYWPGTPNRDWSGTLTLEAGEQVIDLRVEVPADRDSDGMADAWEDDFGLNPTDDSDAFEDPDGDSYTNLDEYRMGTDPFDGTPATPTCGCSTPHPQRFWLWFLTVLPALLFRARRP